MDAGTHGRRDAWTQEVIYRMLSKLKVARVAEKNSSRGWMMK